MTSARRRYGLAAAAVACVAALAQSAPASASGVTLGETASGSGSGCLANTFEVMADPSTPNYMVPAGGGAIVNWSTATYGATAGSSITLLVLTPGESSVYRLAGFDQEKLPTPLPSDHLATFSIPSGLQVPAGAILGLSSATATEECDFDGDPGNSLYFGTSPTPVKGVTYTRNNAGPGTLNVSADLVQTLDAGVAVPTPPASAVAGGLGAFSFSVTNIGTSSGRVTVFDTVPKGLSVVDAISGSGSCTTAGQLVTCTTAALDPGSKTPVTIVVRTSTVGAFTDTATAAGSLFSDPNTANNVASADLAVTAAPVAPSPCRVVALKGVPLRTAKTVLAALHCAVGKVSKKSSKRVAKGDVISTSPGTGSRAAGTKVALVESSGKPRARHERH